VAGPLLAWALLGCQWSSELQSDPASWSPPGSGASELDATDNDDAPSTIDPACRSGATPPLDPALRTSTATGVSHLSGVTCLEGCHVEGGEALTAFVAGGTIYQSQTSREIAGSGGTVENVGGTTLPVDRCGNFYAVVGALESAVEHSQPFVEKATVHRMEKILIGQSNPGSCNQSGCHDFSSKLKWGVYY